MDQNLLLSICPKCGNTKRVKSWVGSNKLAPAFVCLDCRLMWAADQGMQDVTLDACERWSTLM